MVWEKQNAKLNLKNVKLTMKHGNGGVHVGSWNIQYLPIVVFDKMQPVVGCFVPKSSTKCNKDKNKINDTVIFSKLTIPNTRTTLKSNSYQSHNVL